MVIDEGDDDNEDSKLSNIFKDAYCNNLHFSAANEALESQEDIFFNHLPFLISCQTSSSIAGMCRAICAILCHQPRGVKFTVLQILPRGVSVIPFRLLDPFLCPVMRSVLFSMVLSDLCLYRIA